MITLLQNQIKKFDAMDIVARHTLDSLPDSVVERRQILTAVLTACPNSHHAGRISLMLEHLDQHEAILPCRQRPPAKGPAAAVCRALEEALEKPMHDPMRIVLVLVPNPEASAILARELAVRYAAPRLQAGIAAPSLPSGESSILIIENAGRLTRDDLTECRYLINRTRAVLAILVGPEVWSRWLQRWPMEAAPLRRRIYTIFEFNEQTKRYE